MRVLGLKSLRRSVRWLRSRFVDSALILGYHRVADFEWDPYSLCVSPRHFAEQLEALHRYACPMRLQDLVRALRAGRFPRRAVALTFDDGYADNLYHAKPLLTQYQMPATVFIATGYLGREFWWDELDRILPSLAALPRHLSLTIDGIVHPLEAGEERGYRSPKSAIAWRQRVLAWLYRLLEPLAEGERQQAMEQVRAWGGATVHDEPDRKVLSRDEILRLAQGNLVEIGAHTVSHPNLARLPISQQEIEIRQCKSDLETALNRPVSSFAYPHGSLSDATVTAVRDAGYFCACTSSNDIVWSTSNCFQLPRFWPTDSDGPSFARWLSRWLNT